MRPTSSRSVKVTSTDPALVLAAFRQWAEHTRGSRPEIVGVGYFGSYASGRFGPGSDLDVLVVLSHSPHPRFFDRTPDLYPRGFPVAMDIFAYTVDEIHTLRADSSGWMRHVLRETVWVWPGGSGPTL